MRELEAVRHEAVLLQDQMKGVKHDVQKVVDHKPPISSFDNVFKS